MAGDAGRLDFGFEDLFGFFNNYQLVAQCRKFAQFVRRPGVGKAQLQHRRVGEGLLDVHVGRARGDEADAAVAAGFQHIERRGLGHLAQGLVALEQAGDAHLGMRRHHHPALRVLDEAGRLMSLALADRDQALDVADARGQAQQHRGFVGLGKYESLLGHFVGFLRVGRLQHRDVREAAPEARVLLVLRGGHADVVGHGDHQAAIGAGDGHGHQAVAGDIQPDVLHGAEGAGAGHRGAERDFHRDLFVHRPFGMQVGKARQGFEDFGGRRARVGGGDAGAGFPDAARDGLVAGK